MCLKLLASLVLALALALMMPGYPLRSAPSEPVDTLQTTDFIRPGRVTGISAETVSFMQDCQPDSSIEIPWSHFRRVTLNYGTCGVEPPQRPFRAGGGKACDNRVPYTLAYQVSLLEQTQPVYAEQVVLNEKGFRVTLVYNKGILTCDAAELRSKIRSITRVENACPEDISNFPLPKSMRLIPPPVLSASNVRTARHASSHVKSRHRKAGHRRVGLSKPIRS